MTNIGMQSYLFFYLTIEGYRVSAEQQISAALLADSSLEKPDLEMLRDAAISIYNQYLSEKVSFICIHAYNLAVINMEWTGVILILNSQI